MWFVRWAYFSTIALPVKVHGAADHLCVNCKCDGLVNIADVPYGSVQLQQVWLHNVPCKQKFCNVRQTEVSDWTDRGWTHVMVCYDCREYFLGRGHEWAA